LAFTETSVAQVGGGMAMGGRKGMSDVAWHPGNATRLVTSSEDSSSPVVMLCCGIFGMRVLLKRFYEMLGELPIANNWAFQVQFSPSNPTLVANAAFNGTMSLHNTQSIIAADGCSSVAICKLSAG